jgi:hypothetical protein
MVSLSLTPRTPDVPFAIFMASSATSELGTSPLRVTTPFWTATATPAGFVSASAYSFD